MSDPKKTANSENQLEDKNAVEDDYEVHVFATADEEGYSDGFVPEVSQTVEPESKIKSSGLIRVALLGVVLVLSIFLIHKVWGTKIARYYLDEPSPAEQFAPIDPILYSEVVDGWSIAHRNLQDSMSRQKTAVADMNAAKANIEALEKVLELTGQAISDATKEQSVAKEALQNADIKFVELANSNLPAQLADVKAGLVSKEAELLAAKSSWDSARADFAKIGKTVEQLGRATEAAIAAMQASEAAAAAANAAGKSIAEAEGEESESSSLLARLTFNLFNESQPQISGAERAVEAASNALATGEAQLVEISEKEALREEKYKHAKAALIEAKNEEQRLQDLIKQLANDRKKAERALKAAQAANIAAIDALDEKKLVNQQAISKLGTERDAFAVAKSKAKAAADDISTTQQHFEVAEAELSALRKRRARRSAIVLAEVNAHFADTLRAKIGVSDTADPTNDRFALSSEVLFQSGNATLGAAGKKELDQTAAVLKQVIPNIPGDISWVLRVDGHTDATPLSSSSPFGDNWQLSQARSLAVVKYLIAKHGISPSHLAANGFGQFQPIRPGKTPSDLAINRRIELFLTPK